MCQDESKALTCKIKQLLAQRPLYGVSMSYNVFGDSLMQLILGLLCSHAEDLTRAKNGHRSQRAGVWNGSPSRLDLGQTSALMTKSNSSQTQDLHHLRPIGPLPCRMVWLRLHRSISFNPLGFEADPQDRWLDPPKNTQAIQAIFETEVDQEPIIPATSVHVAPRSIWCPKIR